VLWLIVFAAELFNEYADLQGVAPGEATIDAALHDLYNTMLWPTVILLFGRVLFPRRKKEVRQDTAKSCDFADQTFEKPTPV
jgi:hypothetical protein